MLINSWKYPSASALVLIGLLCLFNLFGCGGDSDDDDDSTSSDSSDDDSESADDDIDDDAASPDDDLNDDLDDDTASPDDDVNDDLNDDVNDDLDDDADDDTEYPQLTMPPDDGRLYAAAGRAVITPEENNHPGPIYLGGTSTGRLATGVHDDLLASILILAEADEHVILVSLDLVGFSSYRTKMIQDALGLRGLDPRKILVASTHTHEGPDTVGIWGADPFTSGISPAYQQFIVDAVVDKIIELWDDLTPVSMKAGAADVEDAGSNWTGLIRDSRQPIVVQPSVSAAQFADDAGVVVATLINWHSHPEVVISSSEITSDFPRWVRERIEQEFGGAAIYISGAVGGLQTPLGVNVPERDEQGEPVYDEFDQQAYLSGQSWEAAWSLGYVVADFAMDALSQAQTVDQPVLSVAVEDLTLPSQNPGFLLYYFAGVIESMERVFEPAWLCGVLGCITEYVAVARFGPVTLVTSPGETFPETIVGREESEYDHGGDWGIFTYPALEGYINYVESEVNMHMALCGDEIGYMLPAADYHVPAHPDFYEEQVSLGFWSETLYRQKVIEMLSGAAD